MSRSSLRLALLGLTTTLSSACVSVAPPVRTNHYGAPGRMEAGMVEAAAGIDYGLELSGGPLVGYGISDAVSLEVGGEVGDFPRAIGWLGARYTPLRPAGRKLAFVLDLETGAGAGVGGNRCVDSVCESPALDWQRPAGGAYFGLGIGGKLAWFWPWLRVRTQVSGAEGVPVTSLTTAMIGVQFSISSLAHLYAGTGGFVIVNQEFGPAAGWMLIDGGLSFTIPTARTKRTAR